MTRPSIWHCDPTQYSDHTRGPGYVIVGHVDSPDHAEAHGGNVGDGETAVWVPANVIDALVRERTAELRAENAQYRTLIDAIPFFRDDDYQDELVAAAEAALADPKETTP